MNIDLKNIPCFGIAGNFTGHLEQAGEAESFKNIQVTDENAPKAIFPTYFPKKSSVIPSFLNIFPFSPDKIKYPEGEQKLQIESECAIVFDVTWNQNLVSELKPLCFGASNDCSIRKEGAVKISEKKNWGAFSKGFSSNAIKLDSFDENSILNDYRIASYLLRDGKIFEYGENSAVKSYSYIYEKLKNWIINQFNTQTSTGPKENLLSYLNSIGNPERIMISVGATRYTDFGEKNFLQRGDEAFVILYPENLFSEGEIRKMAASHDLSDEKISFLCEKIV